MIIAATVILLLLGFLLTLFFRIYGNKIKGFIKAQYLHPEIPRHPNALKFPWSFAVDPKTYYMKRFLYWPKTKDGKHENLVVTGLHPYNGDFVIGVSDGEMIKKLLLHDNVPKNMASYGPLKALFGDGLVTMQTNDAWKTRRRLLTPVFHFKSLKAMVSVMSDITAKGLDDLRMKVDDGNGKFDTAPKKETSLITMRITVAVIFGGDFDHVWLTQHFKKLVTAYRTHMTYKLAFGGLYKYKKFEQIRDELLAKIRAAVEHRRMRIKQGNPCDDLISLMLLAQPDNPELLTDETIVFEALLFFFAGYDTTSTTLAWALYILSRNPEIQEKLRQEANTLLPSTNDKIQTKQQISDFKYTKAFIKETLRMYPPAVNIPRALDKDTTMGNTRFKAGQPLLLVIFFAMRDPKLWKDPTTFNPDRFIDLDTNAFSWFPFSAGPRNCIGQNLAMTEMAIILSQIVKRFNVVKPPDQNEDPADVSATFYGNFLAEPNPDLTVIFKAIN